jgi:hypothetical protein
MQLFDATSAPFPCLVACEDEFHSGEQEERLHGPGAAGELSGRLVCIVSDTVFIGIRELLPV